MSTLQDFPNEILGLVFEQLYLLNKQPKGGDMDWECADFQSPNIFPWILFYVCQKWGYIGARYPHFWTRLAFDLASPEVLPLTAFEWSKEYSFEALIFDSRHSETTQTSQMLTEAASTLPADEDASVERKHVEAITSALYPHLPRCRSLEYDVNYSSSLPHLPCLLRHNPIILASIKLNYSANLPMATHPKSAPHVEKALTMTPFSSLSTVCLPVEAFVFVGRIDSRIWESTGRNLTLELYNYQFGRATTSESPETASIAEFLRSLMSLPRISCLKLRNLSLLSLPKTEVALEQEVQSLQKFRTFKSITLENSSRKFLEFFFEVCSAFAGEIHIKNCKLPKNSQRVTGMHLFLYNLPSDANPGRILKNYNGVDVQFNSCYLDDQVIGLLASEDCQSCATLALVDSDGYSIQALKDLVIARKGAFAEYTDDPSIGIDWDSARPMHAIYLKGNGPKPSPKDIVWFSHHLTTFEHS